MLDMNTLVPEILVGVGAAIFIGSLLALFRGRTPSGLRTRNPSDRPRAVAPAQLPGEAAPNEEGSSDKADGTKSSYRLRRGRTIFFMMTGLLALVWGIATILARGF